LSKGFTRFSNPKVTGFMMLNGGLKKQKEKEEEEEKKTFPYSSSAE
jgi:exopolysaccharide biosynthesis protein